MIDHFFYSMYKTCPSPEIRALAREKYLDRISCPEDNRWTNEMDVHVSPQTGQQQ